MNWAVKSKSKTNAKTFRETASYSFLIVIILAVLFFVLFFGLVWIIPETDESKEVQKWCAEYMPELSVRACRTEAGL